MYSNLIVKVYKWLIVHDVNRLKLKRNLGKKEWSLFDLLLKLLMKVVGFLAMTTRYRMKYL